MENILRGGKILKINQFPQKLKKYFELLNITGKQRIIGSAPDTNIKYSVDYDLESHYTGKASHTNLEKIKNLFLSKLKEIKKKKNVWFSDLKAGEINGIPIRWDLDTVKNGQIIRGKKIDFIDALQMPSIIKMDILAIIDGILTEITENYTFNLDGKPNTKKPTPQELANTFLEEEEKYTKEGDLLKALKRKYKRLLITHPKSPLIPKLQNLFNSDIGKFGKIIGDLKTILTAIDLPTPPKANVLKRHIQILEKQLNDISFLPNIKIRTHDPEKIEKIIPLLQSKLNSEIQKTI